MDTLGRLFDQLPFLAAVVGNELLLGLTFLALTATLVGSGIPGTLLPISFSSGALLGGWLGMAVVLAGALIGSQIFFVVARRWFARPVRARWGHRIEKFDHDLRRHGMIYIVGLRLVGAPQLLVNAASALSPISARRFILATTIGLLPAIALASAAGSAV